MAPKPPVSDNSQANDPCHEFNLQFGCFTSTSITIKEAVNNERSRETILVLSCEFILKLINCVVIQWNTHQMMKTMNDQLKILHAFNFFVSKAVTATHKTAKFSYHAINYWNT